MHFIRNTILLALLLVDTIATHYFFLQICQLHILAANPLLYHIPEMFYWIQMWWLWEAPQITVIS